VTNTTAEDFHVYMASDAAKTLVAHTHPRIAGRFSSATFGALTVLTPEEENASPTERKRQTRTEAAVLTNPPPSSAGTIAGTGILAGSVTLIIFAALGIGWLGIPVGATLIAFCAWRAVKRRGQTRRDWTARHRVLTHADARRSLEIASHAIHKIVDAWPTLRGWLELDDPSVALARYLWGLATILAERSAVRDAHDELQTSLNEIAEKDSGQEPDIAVSLERTEARLQSLDAEVERQLTQLERFAAQAISFVQHEKALSRARQALHQADQVLKMEKSTTGPPESLELLERSSAIMAAYQELADRQL
jgi:hypothetical protein